MRARLSLDSRKLEPRRRHPKRQRPIVLPASATACKTAVNPDLIFLPDSLSSRVFLADSGASLSIVPYKSQARPFGPTLRSASGASISARGYKTLQVKFGKTRFNHRLLLADVANPILGMDFFTKFNLLISPPPPTRCCSGPPWMTSSRTLHRAPPSQQLR